MTRKIRARALFKHKPIYAAPTKDLLNIGLGITGRNNYYGPLVCGAVIINDLQKAKKLEHKNNLIDYLKESGDKSIYFGTYFKQANYIDTYGVAASHNIIINSAIDRCLIDGNLHEYSASSFFYYFCNYNIRSLNIDIVQDSKLLEVKLAAKIAKETRRAILFSWQDAYPNYKILANKTVQDDIYDIVKKGPIDFLHRYSFIYKSIRHHLRYKRKSLEINSRVNKTLTLLDKETYNFDRYR